ncbi:MAG: hypothetical protein SGBAC_008708 [Bacillariaceae sp.]
MFSDTSSSIAFGHEFVLQQRVRDIAAKGFSTITIPKPGKKKPPIKKIEPALTLIQHAVDQQEDYLGGLTTRLHHTVRLMERLYGLNDEVAISTMQKVKTIQHEYVHVLRVIAGMKAYAQHISLGLIGPKNILRNLKEIERVPWNKKPSTAGKDALVAMVEEKRYFPVMSTISGKIGFSPKPPSLDYEAGSETFSSSSRSTFASSIPASPRQSFSSIAFGHEFVLQQRVRDIAAKGFSTITIPKPGKKKPPIKKIEPALILIQHAVDQQEDYLGGLAARLHHTVRLMERLYRLNNKVALSTMQKVKTIQHEYVHVLRVIAGMKAYAQHISLGLMGVKNVQRNLKEIELVPWNKKPSSAGKDALVAMVEEKRYFPVMSTSSGKIGFSPKPPSLDFEAGSETFSSTSRSTFASSNPPSPRNCFSAKSTPRSTVGSDPAFPRLSFP